MMLKTNRPFDIGEIGSKVRVWPPSITSEKLEILRRDTVVERGGKDGMVGPKDYYGDMKANKNWILHKRGNRHIEIEELKTSNVKFPSFTAKQKHAIMREADELFTTIECTECDFVSTSDPSIPLSDLSSGGDNVFGNSDRLRVNLNPFPIPVIDALSNIELINVFGAQLVRFGETIPVSQKYKKRVDLLSYQMGRKYVHRLHGEHNGAFIEKHIFPQVMIPLSPTCGGYMMMALETESPRAINLLAFKIPFGYICAISPNTYHGDSYLVGNYCISLTMDNDPDAKVGFFRDQQFDVAKVQFVVPISRCATLTPYVIDLVTKVPSECNPE